MIAIAKAHPKPSGSGQSPKIVVEATLDSRLGAISQRQKCRNKAVNLLK